MANSENYFKPSSKVKELVPSDFDKKDPSKLLKNECCVVLFYAPWCPHCHAVLPVWEQLAKLSKFKVFAMNCEKQRAHYNAIKETSANKLEGFPTIILYIKGEAYQTLADGDDSIYRQDIDYYLRMCAKLCP